LRVALALILLILCSAFSSRSQELKRWPATSAPLQLCIAVQPSREKDRVHYEYLSEQAAKGDLNYELAEEKLKKGGDCRSDIVLDETTIISDLKTVPRMAINAGYWGIHVYVHWHKTHSMGEIILLPHDDGRDEIRYGPVLRFGQNTWRKAAA
jgi:hypothetical protein